MKFAMPAFIASWLIIIIGNGYGLYRGKDVLGVEFAGGTSITMNFDQKMEVDKLRDVASKAAGGDVLIAYQSDIAGGKENLRITIRASGKEGEQIEDSAEK